jgi:tripartite-type tricarboxylate transporter receptor subunit TctC
MKGFAISDRIEIRTVRINISHSGNEKMKSLRHRIKQHVVLLFLTLMAAAVTIPQAATAFPERPVRIIVPYTPGGGVDTLARVMAQKLEAQWGKPVIVENKPGGNTIVATEQVGRAEPDGHTILMVTTVFSVNPSLVPKLPYDTLSAFTPVVLAGIAPNVLVARLSLPVNSVKELIDYARANPGKLNYGNPGVGTAPHLAGELLNADARIKTIAVTYRGAQPSMLALLAGDIDYIFDVVSSLEQVRAGKLKALAVTTSKRLESFPEIPTMIESGLPGYEAATWYGFVVPAKTPSPVVVQINDAFNSAIQSSDVRQRIATVGIQLVGGTPDQFTRYIRSEMEKWGNVIRNAGINLIHPQ